MKQIFTFFICITYFLSFSQFTEDFNDGDFTSNPTWSGHDSLFFISTGQLRSQDTNAAVASYYLTTPSSLALNGQWEFFANLKFSATGANFVDVFLTADQADLSIVQNGYFVRIGGTPKEISLFKLVGGTQSVLIDGTDGIVNSSTNNPFKIKVTRDLSDSWTLLVDDGLTGSFTSMGSATDNTINTSTHFGIRIEQSTALAPKKNHYFDDFYVGAIQLDVTPPSISTITVINATQIDVLFTENVEKISTETIGNYVLVPSNTLLSATQDLTNLSLVHLTFSSLFADGVLQNLNCNGIADLAGNAMINQQGNFTYFAPQVAQIGDIIINEFFCDPSPRIGLAELEFVEIYNKSNKTLNLKNWKIGDASGDGKIADSFILPGEYKVLCATSSIDSFPNTIAVTSFPSLNNTGDDIYLKDSNGVVLDHIVYDLTWYNDAIKDDGGYTLELINPFNTCGGNTNWNSSNSSSGGSPGFVNSIYNIAPDLVAPKITLVSILPPNFISIEFGEKMDSTSLANALISVTPSLNVLNKFISETYPTSILLEFDQPFTTSVLYTMTLTAVSDCSLNDTNLVAQFVVAQKAIAGDLVINEILADPLTNGSDFIEIRNNSDKLIDLKDLEIANFDNDTIANQKKILINYVIMPNDYVVITPDSTDQKQIYPVAVSGKFIQMSLPTFSNDSGSVYLVNGTELLDRVSYKAEWQFALLSSTDGKSLERISPTGNSNEANNWHTAAENVGFASPGRENSQALYGEAEGVFSLATSIFSPDNDGNEDILQLNYSMINAGMVADAKIYDDRGRLIKTLLKAELIGSSGQVTWDGVREDKQKASIGTYILFIQAFDLSGKAIAKKLPFVVAGKI